MIDWHSHVLPQMDDGSRSLEESIELLKMLSAQGVDTVIATPHFYADDESVEDFLKRRSKSYGNLCAFLSENSISVRLGAEVSYYSGISRLEGLSELCVEGSSILLLEMPFARWTEHTVKEVISIAMHGNVTVMLAHVERYMDMQEKDVFDKLREYGVIMQVNSSFFSRGSSKRRALKLLAKGGIQVIGSDTHNITSRPPTLDSAYKVIEKKLGKEFVREIDGYGRFLLD